MKKNKIIAIFSACIMSLSCFVACGEKSKKKPEPPEQEEIAAFDENGNRYVDLVTVDDISGDITYNGINGFIDGYDNYPAFSDVHSDVPFSFDETRKAEDVIGIVHAGGQYNFTAQSYLTEGANVIRKDIGSKVIKLFLGSDVADQYSFNAEWGNYESLTELIKTSEVKRVLSMDFSTVVMVVYEFERLVWNSGTLVSERELERVSGEFYELTRELLRAYNASGKTFVLQNWEGDNELTPALKAAKEADKETIIANYLAYNNARQAGIVRAREELKEAGSIVNVDVLGALEVNYISYNGGGQAKLVDCVVPYSTADVFSFSDWSTANSKLSEDLDYYLSKINENREAGEKKTMSDIALGEFGRAEYYSGSADEKNQFVYSMETAKIAINKGVRYVCYWSLTCNERVGGESARPENRDMKGYWLLKPDGTITETFWYLKGLFENKNFLSVRPKAVMRMPAPQEEPIPFVEADMLFFDNFDDMGLDGPDISRNRKMEGYSEGMNYDHVREADRPLLSRYLEKYGLTDDVGYHVVQKKPNNPNEEYIQYKIVRPSEDAEAKFVMQGFIYDPVPKSMIKVMATKNGTDYEKLSSVYVMDKTGEYGYLYITTRIPVGYTSVRVVFTNTKAANSWDPLICRVAFLK
ncbi:MAG: hypothetical protein IJY62_03690 [Clostridia bacterium]|nr:hypothetical protein [Clostridia bacterium]